MNANPAATVPIPFNIVEGLVFRVVEDPDHSLETQKEAPDADGSLYGAKKT